MGQSQECIIVLGLLGQFPMAGIAWQLIHHLVGFRRLGFEVYYIEDTGVTPYDPRIRDVTLDNTSSLHLISQALSWVEMENAWAYYDSLTGQWYGMSESRIRDLFAHALCTINLCGASNPANLHFRPKGPLLYLETDPVINQVRLAHGDTATLHFLASHNAHVTYGANLGEVDCVIPLPNFDWKKTRPPVVLDLWPYLPDPTCSRFTTITTWQNRGKDLLWKGKVYHWSKHYDFLSMLDLPYLTRQTLELATDLEEDAIRVELQEKGWSIRDTLSVSLDMNDYQRYICESRGEFTVSKEVVARTNSGWFSDRSVCYLAAGKPVVTQETGFSKYVPTGRGLFAFSTKEDVITAFDEINSNYLIHARAAREIAQEYFSADRLLPQLLKDANI